MPRARNTTLTLLLIFLFAACNDREPVPVEKKPEPRDSMMVNSDPTGSFTSIDRSPMDMSYFPDEYPKLKMAKTISTSPLARVIYSRPHRQGRKIFGELLKFGETWRLGANEATEIQFFVPATIGGKPVAAGRYAIYCIPHPDKWIVVLSDDTDTWGLKIDSTKDVARFEATISPEPVNMEYFTMVFEKTNEGADLVMSWDRVEARLPIRF